MNHPILHLPQAKNDSYSNQYYSVPFYSSYLSSRPVPMNRKTPHKTHTQDGDVTKFGFFRGYIQASPFFPETKLSLEYHAESDRYIVSGYLENGKKYHKAVASINTARTILKTTH
jgi:hypothetical protein